MRMIHDKIIVSFMIIWMSSIISATSIIGIVCKYVNTSNCLLACAYCPVWPHTSGSEMHVVKDDWLCEAALWTAWTHYGSCRAAATSVLVCIKAQCFLDAIRI